MKKLRPQYLYFAVRDDGTLIQANFDESTSAELNRIINIPNCWWEKPDDALRHFIGNSAAKLTELKRTKLALERAEAEYEKQKAKP